MTQRALFHYVENKNRQTQIDLLKGMLLQEITCGCGILYVAWNNNDQFGSSETEKLNSGIKQTYNIIFYSVKFVFGFFFHQKTDKIIFKIWLINSCMSSKVNLQYFPKPIKNP